MSSKTVGIPQIVPLLVPKLRPNGRLPLISHKVIVPDPVKVGASGRSLLTVLLDKVKFSGEYERIGILSLMVTLTEAKAEPPELFA